MNKILPMVLIFGLGWSVANANELIYAANGFKYSGGSIAYLGSYYSPLRVFATGENNRYVVPRFPDDPPSAQQAVSEVDVAVLQKAKDFKLPVEAVNAPAAFQNALLMHLFQPAKWAYHPRIAQLCGDKPYALIAVIDFYDGHSFTISLREKENDQTINYWGKRAIIEKDGSFFREKKWQKVAILELYLISVKDGSLLWQAAGVDSQVDDILSNFIGPAQGCAETLLRNLTN